MSVLVKGMEMPKTCGKCKMSFLGEPDYVCCGVTDRVPKIVGKYHNSKIDLDARKKSIEGVERPEWCPLVEVPVPHSRLIEFIDAPVIKDEDTGTEEVNFGDVMRAFYEMRNAPTVIEAEGKE